MRKKQRKPYTQEEDAVVIELVREYPTNLNHAFAVASKRISRTPHSIRQKWYTQLRKSNPIITVGSDKGFTSNRKNTKKEHRGDDLPADGQGLNSFLYMVKNILSLDNKQRLLLVELLTVA